jgi:hypothetical protein
MSKCIVYLHMKIVQKHKVIFIYIIIFNTINYYFTWYNLTNSQSKSQVINLNTVLLNLKTVRHWILI